MPKRFVTIWFRHLKTDWFTIHRPELGRSPFVLSSPDHGRMIITASNALAEIQGIFPGMALADARALVPGLAYMDDKPEIVAQLLKALALRFIRYTPVVGMDLPDGLILDATGCAHLWGGEREYLTEIYMRLKRLGYSVRIGMADTIGAAWAITHFRESSAILASGGQAKALLALPPAALRLPEEMLDRMQKLGFRQIRHFITMPRPALERRFGDLLIRKLNRALGLEDEPIEPVIPIEPYQERLPCLELIITATGIDIALERLLEKICHRLRQEEKGLRKCSFLSYRADGKIEKIEIGTHRPTHKAAHLHKLFEPKLATIEPGPGIELFVIEAMQIEALAAWQEKIWEGSCDLEDDALSELIDHVTNKIGYDGIHRFLPDEHHWPERSYKKAGSWIEKPSSVWRSDKPRPLELLSRPEPVEVSAPLPDYPPILFRYKNKVHTIKKADGPERIEREWWLEEGPHRDYYAVEDEEGNRYWLYRSGHYSKNQQWFIHGFFA